MQIATGGPNVVSNPIGYAQYYSRSRDVVIRVYEILAA
jgi:hypothetical protein